MNCSKCRRNYVADVRLEGDRRQHVPQRAGRNWHHRVGCARLWSNIAIVGAARRAARQASPDASFFGRMFCFWLGQFVRMPPADLLTYWRRLLVYYLVLAWAVRVGRVPAP
jgi:hypothetical protein